MTIIHYIISDFERQNNTGTGNIHVYSELFCYQIYKTKSVAKNRHMVVRNKREKPPPIALED